MFVLHLSVDNDMITAPDDRVNMTSITGAFMLKLSQLVRQILNL